MAQNREFTVAVTTSYQNLGTLLAADADYTSGRGIFNRLLIINTSSSETVTIKGTGNTATVPASGGIVLGISTSDTKAFEWTTGFNAKGTWIKASGSCNVNISGIEASV